MKLFHRSQSQFAEVEALSFYTEGVALADESYGSEIMVVEITGDLASEKEVLEVVEKMGMKTEDVEMTYEYLSKNLGTVDAEKCHAIAAELLSLGFVGAKLPDFCCPESVVLFEEVDVNSIA